MTDRFITLNEGGPDPETLEADGGDPVSITNNLGADAELTLSQAGLLNPSMGRSLTVPVEGWNGRIGYDSGTYSYEAGDALDTRTGTIDIG